MPVATSGATESSGCSLKASQTCSLVHGLQSSEGVLAVRRFRHSSSAPFCTASSPLTKCGGKITCCQPHARTTRECRPLHRISKKVPRVRLRGADRLLSAPYIMIDIFVISFPTALKVRSMFLVADKVLAPSSCVTNVTNHEIPLTGNNSTTECCINLEIESPSHTSHTAQCMFIVALAPLDLSVSDVTTATMREPAGRSMRGLTGSSEAKSGSVALLSACSSFVILGGSEVLELERSQFLWRLDRLWGVFLPPCLGRLKNLQGVFPSVAAELTIGINL